MMNGYEYTGMDAILAGSFRAVVLDCPHFQSQRVKKGMDKGGKRAK